MTRERVNFLAWLCIRIAVVGTGVTLLIWKVILPGVLR